MDFYHFQKSIKSNYWIHLVNASKKVIHKAGEFTGDKIADAVTKSNDDNNEEEEPVEEIIIPPGKRDEILNKLRKVL